MPRLGLGWTSVPWLAAYLVFAAAVLVGLFELRRRAIDTLDNPEARGEWRQWKDATGQAAAAGQPQRRPVKTDEPPGLILLRDHFAMIVATSLLIGSLLFLFMAWILRGLMRGGGPT